MARFNHVQNTLLGGELSPKMALRTELPQYQQGCADLKNQIPIVEGGARRRPGTRYLGTTAFAEEARLIPFVINETTRAFIVLSQNDIGVWDPDTGIYTSGGTSLSPAPSYTTAELKSLQYAQSGNFMWLVHPNHQPLVVTLSISGGAANLAVSSLYASFSSANPFYSASAPQREALTVPFRDPNIDIAQIFTVAAGFGTGVGLTCVNAFFNAGHVGALFTFTNTTPKTGVFRITAVTNSTTATISWVKAITGVAGAHSSSDWSECAWSDYRGWPRSVEFYENRLVYGGNASQPDTFWGSRSANYFHMMAKRYSSTTGIDWGGYSYYDTAVDSDPVVFTLSSRQANSIQWLSGKQVLNAGTYGSEHVIQGSAEAALSATNIQTRNQTDHGSSYIQPAKASYATFFVQRDGKRVREFSFNFDSDSYEALDLSQYADHLAGKKLGGVSAIKSIAWAESDKTLWCIDSNGGLFSCTRDKKLGVSAWAYHELGGSGYPVAICTIPSSTGHDDLILQVKRHIGGTDIYTIEKIGADYAYSDLGTYTTSSDAPYYLDCATFKNLGSVTTAVTGLAAFNGETFAVVGDGKYLGTYLVSGGGFTLTTAARYLVIGYAYQSKVKTMNIEAGSVIGSAQGAIMRIDRVGARFYRTVGAKIGYSDTSYEDIEFRPTSVAADAVIPMFTGDKLIDFTMSPERAAYVEIIQDLPFPMTVLGIFARGDTRDQ